MSKENDKILKDYDIDNPFVSIGFGFFFMLIGGAFFASFEIRSYDNFFDFFENFVYTIWLPYVFISGPFIVYGLTRLIVCFTSKESLLKYITPGTAALSHYASMLALLSDALKSKFVLVFFSSYAVFPIMRLIYLKMKEKKNKDTSTSK